MNRPLISIIGATGTGKSHLAVELALALNGEIINADAMQMYEGLTIVTNKITEEERKGVPHHLLGFLGPHTVSRVGQFVTLAEKIIEEIRRRGRLPIVVGGTHYYIQSLLFPHSILHNKDQDAKLENDADPFSANALRGEELVKKYPILDAETSVIYEKLKEVDPLMATRWHPNDRRKIRRSLAIHYSMNGKKTASEVYAAQREERERIASIDRRLSLSDYQNLVIWVHADNDTLRSRLDTRVDKMIEAGLTPEILEMDKLWISLGGGASLDLSCGIWQSIGFKEFLPYFERSRSGTAPIEVLSELRDKAIKDMKSATRNYAKLQIRWIRIKFLNALRAANMHAESNIYLIDSSDLSRFNENVIQPSIRIAKNFLAQRPLPDPLSLSSLAKVSLTLKRDFDIGQRPDLWIQNKCELCDVVTTTKPDWELHIHTRKHKKKVDSAKKKEVAKVFIAGRIKAEKECSRP